MGWRHIMITQPIKLSIKQQQLVIKQDVEVTVPLQDISTITLEHKQTIITQSVLSACASNRIALISCDNKKLPDGIFTSYHQHSRQLTVLNMQQSLSKPLKKRLWQQIVKQKIMNQANCLDSHGCEESSKLLSIARQVESGDTSNREGYAAKIYFPQLFGSSFTRRANDSRNRLLNYGYSIMRSTIARSLVAYGFTPCLGIHHDSQTNPFNLADDFMEVLRPLVDMHIVELPPNNWDVNTRASIVNLLNKEVEINGAMYVASSAADEMVKSFVAVCRQNDISYLKLLTIPRITVNEAI
ncbi:type II CRISPR-associated endonuclease Cas1 [Salsuginibacillus kocurii]|uniref:type II CRISPR-associated endonuclease Cas1 n=1 Tax=Salsuginibacillus kocurii TaxID=427078 RepID=UPI000379CB41|nr:type II CRISPR-associated endonuclease Cas1 [Salsuginibacillus kocurii]